MQKKRIGLLWAGYGSLSPPAGQKICTARVGRSLKVVGCKQFSTAEVGTGRVGSNQPRQRRQRVAVKMAPIASHAHCAKLNI